MRRVRPVLPRARRPTRKQRPTCSNRRRANRTVANQLTSAVTNHAINVVANHAINVVANHATNVVANHAINAVGNHATNAVATTSAGNVTAVARRHGTNAAANRATGAVRMVADTKVAATTIASHVEATTAARRAMTAGSGLRALAMRRASLSLHRCRPRCRGSSNAGPPRSPRISTTPRRSSRRSGASTMTDRRRR